MATDNLKFVVGSVQTGQPAKMKIFGDIGEYTAWDFEHEFEWVEAQKPSVIKILINSAGGSVLHGMSIYTVISNSDVPTVCINEGLAASMGSVILAAGDKAYMRDYAILMIHNPFDSSNANTESAKDFVAAYKEQISTIYHKRFGLSRDQIKAIMDGEEGKDGTLFTSEEAVNAGIIPSNHILVSQPQIRNSISEKVIGAKSDMGKIASIFASVSNSVAGEIDESPITQPIIEDNSNLNKSITKTERIMEENTIPFELGAVAAALGFTSKFQTNDVMAKITELKGIEARLTAERDGFKQELDAAKIVNAGHESTISNLQEQLQTAQTELGVFKTEAEAKKTAEIKAVIDGAIAEGKIKNDAAIVASWTTMATNNLDLVKATLASIPAVTPISAQISNDPANVAAAKSATEGLEAQVEAKIKEAVGEGFKFEKL